MIRMIAAACLLLTAASAGLPYPSYGASALQRKADLSISAIPIDTPFSKVKARLTVVPGSCEADENCEWTDKAALGNARPNMIATLNSFRDTLEDMGNGLGVTDAVSGDSVVDLNA